MDDLIVERIIEEAAGGEMTLPDHINTRDSRGRNALLKYLSQNIATADIIATVRFLTNHGASLVSKDDNGRTPLLLLANRMGCDDNDPAIFDIIRKNKKKLPVGSTSPYLIIYRRMRACGALMRYRHPIRRLLMYLVENEIVPESWDSVVARMEKAIQTGTYDFVVDIVDSTGRYGRPFDMAMNRLLRVAIRSGAQAQFIRFLLLRGATPNTHDLARIAKRGDYGLFRRTLDFAPPNIDIDAILSSVIRSQGDERIIRLLLSKGAKLKDKNVLADLIRNDRKYLIQQLYKHGTQIFLPSGVPDNSASRFVRDELHRLRIIQDMGDPSKAFTKNKDHDKLWQRVAQQTTRLPPDVVRELRSMMN